MNPPRAAVVQRAGRDVDVVGRVADELQHRPDLPPDRAALLRRAPFGLPVVPDV